MDLARTLADLLLQTHGADLRDVAVMLPNQRAGVHLRRHLATRNGGPLWSPQIFTTRSFLSAVAELEEMPEHVALLALHAVHSELKGEAAEPLHEFLLWAPTALHDMNEVDEHLLDPASVYRDLRHIEEIDAWSYKGGSLSEGQLRLATHWEHHGELHAGLHGRVAAMGVAPVGRIAREAARNATACAQGTRWKSVWFVGLNALVPAMRQVIEAFTHAGKSRIIWDADHYYLDDPMMEAGHFLRLAQRSLGPGLVPPTDRIRHAPPSIELVALPDAISQVQAAVARIMALDLEERARTCLVLADEQLLLPVLTMLPADMGPVSVSMGLPLGDLPLTSLIDLHLRLLQDHDARSGHRISDLLAWCGHSLWQSAAPMRELRAKLKGSRQSRVHLRTLLPSNEVIAPSLEHLELSLSPLSAKDGAIHQRLLDLIQAIQYLCTEPFVLEQAYRTAVVLQEVQQALSRAGYKEDVQSYRQLLERLLRKAQLTLSGEPLQGLQIIGMLESRATEHHRVILLGANEGHLPPADGPTSFIPGELRLAYGLPSRSDADAISAYGFYRILHHAQEVLLYFVDDGQAEKERSRFILQLEHELFNAPGRGPRRSTLRPAMPTRPHPPREVAKSPALLEAVRTHAERGLSPSAFSSFVRCPLDYYYRYLVGVQDAQDRGAGLGNDEVGTVVHAVLERIYSPHCGKHIDPRELADSMREIPQLLRSCLPAGRSAEEGAALLQLGMARHALGRAVGTEVSHLEAGNEIILLGLETELAHPLPPPTDGSVRPPVRVKGRIDRIDMRHGLVNLVDMKTGSAEPRDLNLRTLDLADIDARHTKALQLLIYSWLYLNRYPDAPRVRASILPLRSSGSPQGIPLVIAGEDSVHRVQLPAIATLLRSLVDRMGDPRTPFRHEPTSAYCRICME
ncbi:MAG: PD-(D/E)XK nuclease family protein [Flavobacteriales bacterium]|nr:PD-(D/E)XK nuclease family protein [Flavobacteriales bacterium]